MEIITNKQRCSNGFDMKSLQNSDIYIVGDSNSNKHSLRPRNAEYHL